MPWTTRFLWISFLLCGASWLFPPALLITAPIFAVAIIVWVVAAIGSAFRGASPPPPHKVEPPAAQIPPDITLDELWRMNNPGPPEDRQGGR